MIKKMRIWGAAFLAALTLPLGQAAAQEKDFVFYGLSFEQLEFREGIDDSGDALAWDGDAFLGNDEWKLRLISTGEYGMDEKVFEVLEHQLVLQRLATDFFDVKAGLRYDAPFGPNRWYGVFGVHGLSQQWFEIDADLFLSEKGDLSARLDADYELLITNRWILTPSLEIDFAFSDDKAIGVEAGFVSAEVGLRLSYDLVDRAISPYVGIHYERLLGNSADLARGDGEAIDGLFAVAGVKILF